MAVSYTHLSYTAMQQAFSPQYVFTLLDPEPAVRGQPLELPIYVVNEDVYKRQEPQLCASAHRW